MSFWKILLLPALLPLVYYLSKHNRYRWIFIMAKTFRRDMTASVRFLTMTLYLYYWEKMQISLPKVFRSTARKYPAKVAIFFEDEKWTYQELEDFSNRVAHYFKENGFRKGDTVALLLENRPEYVGLWVGLSKLGVITALINTNLVSDPLVHCITAVNSKTLIYGSDFQKTVSDVKDKLQLEKLFEFKTKDVSMSNDAADVKEGLDKQPTTSPSELKDTNSKDKLVYIYTSGTTGLPKAAVLSHLRYMYAAAGFHFMCSVKDNDIVYDPLPLYHSAGGMLGVGQCVIFGTSIVIRRKFSASGYWNDCKKYHCTVAQYIGELCRFLLTVHKEGAVVDHSVRSMIGNGLRPELWQKFQGTFKIKQIYEFYGSTEGNVNIVNIDNTVGAVGFVPRPAQWLYPCILVRCHEDTGEPIRNKDGFMMQSQPGEHGLLIGKIRKAVASSSFLGYADEKASSKKVFTNVFEKGDAYFNSGDILVQDELGYFYFKDRIGDTFRWKGENVATNEVESVMNKVIGLNDTTVYGVEIPGTDGKAGMAAIVDPNNQLDTEHLGSKLKANLPAYAVPLFLRVLDALPMTTTFKFKKTDLKKEGFNVNAIKDKLYFFDSKSIKYVPLTNQLYEDILNGRVRL